MMPAPAGPPSAAAPSAGTTGPLLPPQLPVQGYGQTAPLPPLQQRPATPPAVTPPSTPSPAASSSWLPAGVQHWGDLIGYNFEKGLIGLPLGAIDLANQGLRAATGDRVGYVGTLSNALNQELIRQGMPQPQTSGEEWAADIAGAAGGTLPFLPFAVPAAASRAMTASILAREAAGAAGAGSGQYIAERGGAGPVGQAVAATLGAMSGNLAGATAAAAASRLRLATNAGRQAAAGRILAQSSGAPGTLEQRLATSPQVGLPTAPRTTAMVSGDPNLMVTERALRATPEGAGIRAVEAQRNQAIADALRTMTTAGPQTAAQRGSAIRGVLRDQERAMGQRTDQLYTAARAAPGSASLNPVLGDIARLTRERYGGGGAPAPAVWARISRQIVDRSARGPVNSEWLMNMDKQLGNEAGKAAASGDRTLAGALGALRTEVGKLSPNAAYDAAKGYRAQVGRVTGRDATGAHAVGDVLSTDRFGMPRTSDEQVLNKVMVSSGAVRQTLDAADEAVRAAQASGGDVAGMIARRDALQTHLKDAFIGGAERQQVTGQTAALTPGGAATTVSTFSPAKWSNFWRQNEQVAQELFGPQQLRTLQQITEQVTGRMLVAAVNKLPTLIGLHAHGGVGAMAGHVLSHDIVGALSRRPDEAIRTMLSQAASDPAFAQILLQKANASTLTQVAQSHWLQRLLTSSPVRTVAKGISAMEAGYGRAPADTSGVAALRASGEL
jgi:hypothetical protein